MAVTQVAQVAQVADTGNRLVRSDRGPPTEEIYIGGIWTAGSFERRSVESYNLPLSARMRTDNNFRTRALADSCH